MKKIKIHLLCLATIVFFSSYMNVNAQSGPACNTGTYVISAYYSPVPGQSRYATGTYEGDIRLNGGGVMTASGTPVATAQGAFVAAPPCMPFGTQLDIEGLGTHQVLDRGGAIKGNRLDIWMGYGDVGLKNALTWGKRTVFVSVNGQTGTPSNFSFDTGKDSLKIYQVTSAQDPYVFPRDLAFGDTGEDVARLQQILKDLAFYKNDVTGAYDSNTKLAVESFNIANGVIKPSNVNETGRFGSTSVASLKFAVVQNREKYFKNMATRNLGRGSKGEDVKKLQELLLSLGLINSITGVYDAETVKAVLAFQIAEGVLKSDSDQGAGYFGPMTQIAFDKVVLSMSSPTSGSKNLKSLASNSEVSLASMSVDLMITQSLQEGSSGEEVTKLQQILKDLNLLRIEPSGYFGPLTAHAVFKFQQRVGLITSNTDQTAGFVGPATRNELNKYINNKNKIVSSIKSNLSLVSLESSFTVTNEFQFATDLKVGSTGIQVEELQKFLKKKGYFSGQLITDYFGPVTKSALIKFKQDNNLNVDGNLFDENVRKFVNQLI